MTDLAANLYGITTVAIYDTLGNDSIQYIMEQTNIKTIFASTGMIDNLIKQEKLKSVQFIVYFKNQQPISQQQEQSLVEKGYKVIGMDLLRQTGAANILPFSNVYSNTISTISYTSGTTGDPKGVMLSQNNIVSTLGSL